MEFNATLRPTGELVIHRRKDMDNWLASLAGEKDIPFLITIEKKKRKRSTEVNRYWWSVLIPIIQRGLTNAGHDVNKEETHEFLKANFCYEELVNEDTAEILRVPRSTAKLTGSEFWELIDRVARFASEYLSEIIPPPGEQAEIDYENTQP